MHFLTVSKSGEREALTVAEQEEFRMLLSDIQRSVIDKALEHGIVAAQFIREAEVIPVDMDNIED